MEDYKEILETNQINVIAEKMEQSRIMKDRVMMENQ